MRNPSNVPTFNLERLVVRHPINDKAYMRHLQTADLFHANEDARAELRAAQQAEEDARCVLHAARLRTEQARNRVQAEKAKTRMLTGDALREGAALLTALSAVNVACVFFL